MTTWHERLQEALTARTKDWPDLAKAVGKTKQSVYKWKPNAEDRTKQMDWDNAIKVCKFLRIEHDWLRNGSLPSGLELDADQAFSKKPRDWPEDTSAVADLYTALPAQARVALRSEITKIALPYIKDDERIEKAIIGLFKAT